MANVLIIDDDPGIRDSLTLLIEHMGHRALEASTLSLGCELAFTHPVDVVFLDVRMPDGNGLDALHQLEQAPTTPEIIIITGYGDPKGAELAIKSGAWDYIEKTSSSKEIILALDRAIQYRQEKQAVRKNTRITTLKREEIIGDSQKLRACLDSVAQSALGEANVLITGETGTGKELFARAIHRNSRRAKAPFSVVDCAALPENLVESLLFGHEKGTFTGAEKTREGLIDQANGGTLFLDEVGELPLSMQKAFLRVLQEHRFRPLGSSQERESDFRLIAATNRNLDQLVDHGGFRGDLLFRLRSFHIELPPLRERPDDIRELTRVRIDQLCERKSIPSKGFSQDFIPTLLGYSWPGNVRELFQTLERALDAAFLEPTLFSKHLPINIRAEVAKTAVTPGKESPAKETTAEETPAAKWNMPTLQEFRDSIYEQAEKQYLGELMLATHHNIQMACQLSGLSQSRLYALLKRHQISRSG
ncbi:MAG: sigma-54 dependent transcriptional regulator [Desulfuromonadaceae bacterium]